MENFEKCTVAMLGGPWLNRAQSAVIIKLCCFVVTVHQFSRGESVAAGLTAGHPRPLPTRGRSGGPYHVIIQFYFYPVIKNTKFNQYLPVLLTSLNVSDSRFQKLVMFIIIPHIAREFQGFRVWGKFVFRTLELMDTPTNLANQVKVDHALDQSRSVQSRGPERAHQNNEPSWRSSRTDRRLSRQFCDD